MVWYGAFGESSYGFWGDDMRVCAYTYTHKICIHCIGIDIYVYIVVMVHICICIQIYIYIYTFVVVLAIDVIYVYVPDIYMYSHLHIEIYIHGYMYLFTLYFSDCQKCDSWLHTIHEQNDGAQLASHTYRLSKSETSLQQPSTVP